MAKTNYQLIDEYIAAQPQNIQVTLSRLRGIIRKAMPKAEEAISYQIPAYKLHGSPVLFFAGWKEHISLYPVTDALAAAFKTELAPYKVSKGTIRFPLSEPIPAKLVARIVKFRAKEAEERQKTKAAKAKKR